MKLRDMLNEVGILVPNDIPPDVLVSWMNQVQNSLYRLYGSSDEAAYPFTVQPGVSLYDLPANCLPERARRLIISEREVHYIPSNEDDQLDSTAAYWTILNKQIVVFPVPATVQNATLYFLPSPTALSLSAIDAVPTFPADFIELLVLGCAVKVAMAVKSDILATLQGQFETLQARAQSVLGRRQNRVNIVRAYT